MVSAGAMILKQVKLQVIAFNSNMYTILHISSLDSYLTFVQQKWKINIGCTIVTKLEKKLKFSKRLEWDFVKKL
jgi:hypothetical protein